MLIERHDRVAVAMPDREVVKQSAICASRVHRTHYLTIATAARSCFHPDASARVPSAACLHRTKSRCAGTVTSAVKSSRDFADAALGLRRPGRGQRREEGRSRLSVAVLELECSQLRVRVRVRASGEVASRPAHGR